MTGKITRDILESFRSCKYKGYLKLMGQHGTKSDYEYLLLDMRAEVQVAAIKKILTGKAAEEISRNIVLTTSALNQGAFFVLEATLEDDLVSLVFDGLKKMDGPSKLGDFHYAPILFHEGEKVGKELRLLLAMYGVLLSELQGKTSTTGIIYHGKNCRATELRLTPDLRNAQRLLEEVKGLASAEAPLRLMLNGHCQVCEFRQRCHAQAVQQDNISLLRGMSEKEVKSYARKYILTVTQLAHTFRPRRKGKRAPKKDRRYHALQALSIRDKKIYVFGTPELPDRPYGSTSMSRAFPMRDSFT